MSNPKNESELQPLIKPTDKSLPRIRRLPTKLFADSATLESGESSNQPVKKTGQPSNQPIKKSNTAVVQVTNLDESHPRFGPVYIIQQQQVDAIKNKAWEQVLKKSPDEPEETTELYLAAIRRVEREAKEMYAGKVPGIGSQFRWMMIKDGCFFLQLALLILGCSHQLGYSTNDPIFGKEQKRNEVKKWMEAMFYAGNQLPLVVLRELMDQKFFRDVVGKAKLDAPASSLCKRVLYDNLVVPVLKRGSVAEQQQLCDLLHGCQHLVMGPATEDHIKGEHRFDDEIDLEANEDEAGEYERIFPATLDEEEEDDESSHGGMSNRIKDFLNAVRFTNADDNRSRIFPSATELKRRGIRMKKLKSGGARGIHYKSYYFWAYLYLPAFPVDSNAELILRNLKNYDSFQQSGKNGQEVSSYLRFLSDLVQTTRDARLLHNKDIIQGKSDDVEKLPAMLNRLSSEDIRLTQELRILRSQIRDYSSPWIHYKGVINLVVFLTLLQTLFALLAYFRPPKSN